MAEERRSSLAGILLLGSAAVAGIAKFGPGLQGFLIGVGAELVADELQERAGGSILRAWGDALIAFGAQPDPWIGASLALIIALVIVCMLLRKK